MLLSVTVKLCNNECGSYSVSGCNEEAEGCQLKYIDSLTFNIKRPWCQDSLQSVL